MGKKSRGEWWSMNANAYLFALALAAALVWVSGAKAAAGSDRGDAKIYTVVNVPVGDTLALRARPDYRSARLADIPRAGVALQGLGPAAIAPGGLWLRVRVMGRTGWVNARFVKLQGVARAAGPPAQSGASASSATPPAVHVGLLDPGLDCAGHAPFWILRVDPGSVRLRDQEASTRIWSQSVSASAGERRSVTIAAGPSPSQPALKQDFVGRVTASARCASDTGDGGYAIRFTVGRRSFTGCCTAIVAARRSS
jgi:uncharacterized membrane protein